MITTTDSIFETFPDQFSQPALIVDRVAAAPVPVFHPAEADVFARHAGIPGHDQSALRYAHVVLVGAGGLNSWVAVGLARSGIGRLTVIDADTVERTNLTRQFFTAADLGQPKAHALIHNLRDQSTGGAEMVSLALPVERALQEFNVPADLLIVGVDNNAARLFCVETARRRHIPAVFTLLSRDGMRVHAFLQGALDHDACLWCALPNLDPASVAPCASAIVSTCLLAGAYTQFFAHRALMGWMEGVEPFNWRAADLMGIAPDQIGQIARRDNCRVCGRG